ncbi:MAG TPA: GMC family oxidoreductase [Pyrinomonadaceae bacterium]|jgi:cholesterol oxidase
MAKTFDVIVIGSGFGGAITGCRLAEKGLKVLILERGRRWHVDEYPRAPEDAWFYDHKEPQLQNGWLDFRFLRKMVVAQGAGVGGGSLVYANVCVEPNPDIFEHDWPPEITYNELKPHYDMVGKMLRANAVPPNQLPPKQHLIHDAAVKLGYGDRFGSLPIAISFDPEFSYDRENPFADDKSKPFINEFGQEQGTCVHCGNCDLGCQVKARNTLDLNYIPLAEQHGAEVRPLHIVKYIEPADGGYRVYYDRLENERRIPGTETADRVIIAGGSLNSTEILLRSKLQYKTLPLVSDRLGDNWSSNADFLSTSDKHPQNVLPSEGPTITSIINFGDGVIDNKRFVIEDGGKPDFLGNILKAKIERTRIIGLFKKLLRIWYGYEQKHVAQPHVMYWFAAGVDAADGRLSLGRHWWAPWQRVLKLDWKVAHSKPVIDAIVKMQERLGQSMGGDSDIPWTWRYFANLITAHPLGGCKMGTTAADGVVDHRGEVFGYPNLYVADGSILPESVGINPSRTIGALAERIAALIE